MDKGLLQGLHFDDCDSLNIPPVAATVSATSTIEVLCQRVQRSQSLLSHIHSSISSMQAAAAQVDQDIMADLLEILRIEGVKTPTASTPFSAPEN